MSKVTGSIKTKSYLYSDDHGDSGDGASSDGMIEVEIVDAIAAMIPKTLCIDASRHNVKSVSKVLSQAKSTILQLSRDSSNNVNSRDDSNSGTEIITSCVASFIDIVNEALR